MLPTRSNFLPMLIVTAVVCSTRSGWGQNGHSFPPLPALRMDDSASTDLHSQSTEMNTEAITLKALESLALQHNPTLTQASAQIQGAGGAAFQAGRLPNPSLGYVSDQIGINGTAGELQGGFISQEIITGGKLRLSRAKFSQRARIAEINASSQQYRVINDVRVHYYRALGAESLVEVQQQLFKNAVDNVQTTQEMFNLGQANQADWLLAQVQARRQQLIWQRARNNYQLAWENLITIVGTPELALTKLDGSLEPTGEPLQWETALSQLLSESPELCAAHEKIRHDEIVVRRERAEPIPDITVQATTGYNAETLETVAGLQVGFNLPIFDRNRGTISQAEADLVRSHAEVRRLELDLRRRLAGEFRRYQTARQHVTEYRETILPQSKKAHKLLLESYKKRRAAWPDVLMTERSYFEFRAEYVRQLVELQEAEVAIRGLLLSGGLTEAPPPITGGHIDATPRPR